MVNGELSLADFTVGAPRACTWNRIETHCSPHSYTHNLSFRPKWFPTIIFMEFMLPRVFDWPDLFNEPHDEFSALRAWFTAMKARPEFASVHADICECGNISKTQPLSTLGDELQIS